MSGLNRGPWTKQEDASLIRNMINLCQPAAFPKDTFTPWERSELGISAPARRPIADVQQRCRHLQEQVWYQEVDVVPRRKKEDLAQNAAAEHSQARKPDEPHNAASASTSQALNAATAAASQDKPSEQATSVNLNQSAAKDVRGTAPAVSAEETQQQTGKEKEKESEEEKERENTAAAEGTTEERKEEVGKGQHSVNQVEEAKEGESSSSSTQSRRKRSRSPSKKINGSKKRTRQSSMVIEGSFESLQVERIGRASKTVTFKGQGKMTLTF